MTSYSHLLLIIMSLSLVILAESEILSWYVNHQICSAEIILPKADIASKRMNYTCRDSAYLTYMRTAILQVRCDFIDHVYQ